MCVDREIYFKEFAAAVVEPAMPDSAEQACRVETLRRRQMLPSCARISSSGKACVCFSGLSADWMRPSNITENNLLYLKSTDCRC